MHVDGKCKECGKHADMYCDGCGLYVCKDHIHTKKARNTYKKFFFCKKCLDKDAKPTNARKRLEPANFDVFP